jgi:hypothetical protein
MLNRGAKPNQTDWDRLAAVRADPVLANAEVSEPGKPLDTSARVYAMRGYLHWNSDMNYDLPSDPQALWTEANAKIQPFLNEGWNLVGMRCDPTGEVSLLGLKEFEGVTVALQAGVFMDRDSNGVRYVHFSYTAVIPFHSESNDPWQWSLLSGGPVCLDASGPPPNVEVNDSGTPVPIGSDQVISAHVVFPADSTR